MNWIENLKSISDQILYDTDGLYYFDSDCFEKYEINNFKIKNNEL